MTYTVSISQVQAQFKRCHSSVIQQLGGNHNITKLGKQPLAIMRQAWLELYGIHIHRGKVWGHWVTLEFDSEQDFLLWMIKWS